MRRARAKAATFASRARKRLRDAVVTALGKIHAVLDSGRGLRLAYLIRTGRPVDLIEALPGRSALERPVLT